MRFNFDPFFKILNAGVVEDLRFAEKRNLRILNGIAMILIGIAMIFTLLLILNISSNDFFITISINLFLFFLAFFVIWFNKKQQYHIAMKLLFLGSIFFLSGLPFYTQTYSGVNLYLFVLIAASVLFFDTSLARVVFISIAGIALITSTYLTASPQWSELFEFYEVHFFINSTIAVVMMYFMLYSFKNESQKYQEQVEQSNNMIGEQNKRLNAKNTYIKSSIDYAQRIQSAILPEKIPLEKAFVLYQPKDIVSGDFYWAHQEGHKTWIAVGDCTGHGVPGAMLSMLSISLLDRLKKELQLSSPAEILSHLDNEVRITLRQEKGNNNDGLDISLCLIDTQKKQITFSAARNPLYIIAAKNPEKVIEIKGAKRSIGGKVAKKLVPFVDALYDYEPNTCCYMSSDGYRDQFGGSKNKKLGSKKLKELLLEFYPQNAEIQHKALKTYLETWRKEGNESQIDDICLLGMRL
ncbi:MAG: SpoIIE family protein phosphatase [Bernardetiaceae bacterium]|nr:SpoIIE family protein phosphatase [Bernardetiaceae bacterium]